MKIGRNDPCPCGSGKKYKKCCLEKDQAAERAQPALPIQLSSALDLLPARPVDPRANAIYARWEEFQQQDYESQIALFTRSLIPSMETNHTARISRIMTAMREDKTLDWRKIVDGSRPSRGTNTWSDPDSIIRAAVEGYRRNYWQDQPVVVEVWSDTHLSK